jgi:hypothetical protein
MQVIKQRKGNLLLGRIFEWAHHGAAGRARVPPFLVFGLDMAA